MRTAASSPIRTDTPPSACRVMIVIAPAPPAASRHAPNAAAMAAILLECIGYSPQTAASMAFRLPSPGRLQYLVHLCQRSDEHTSELQSLMRTSYAVFCLKKTNNHQ